jgi:hypothetical protein
MNTLTRAFAKLGRIVTNSITIGWSTAGTRVYALVVGTVSIDPASLAALTKVGEDFTLTGAQAGDAVIMIPPATLEDDLIPCGAVVTAADTVTVYLYNSSDGAVDGADLTWTYMWYKLVA